MHQSRSVRFITVAARVVVIALLLEGALLPSSTLGQTPSPPLPPPTVSPPLPPPNPDPPIAIGAVDMTASSDCRILFERFEDDTYTKREWSSGWQSCQGDGAVIRTVPIYSNDEANAVSRSNIATVSLTGNLEADQEAVDQLARDVAQLDAVPDVGSGENADADIGIEANRNRCKVGRYPKSWRITGSYKIYKYDGGPVDTQMMYSAKVKRISCTVYRMIHVAQWLADGDPAEQRLWFKSVTYDRSLASSSGGRTYPGYYRLCIKHPSGSGAATRIEEDVRPSDWYLYPNGVYSSKTTNDGVDDCMFWGEDWYGYVTARLPSS